MKIFLTKLYILFFMALTVVFMILIWKLTLGKLLSNLGIGAAPEMTEISAPVQTPEVEASFKKIVLESDETVKHYLGYRVLEEMKIEGHFHHIDYEMEPDNRSSCVACHGDIPHTQKKEIRAFVNMHSAFIACETCHVRLEEDNKTDVFKWYDRKTGEIIPSPIVEGESPGMYHAKIVPFEKVQGSLQRIDSLEGLDVAADYLEREKTLSAEQKTEAKKNIHSTVDKKPYLCEDCHRAEGALLPFEDLGYSTTRINHLVSTEVIGMIRDYTKFFVPRMLHPGLSDSEAENIETQ